MNAVCIELDDPNDVESWRHSDDALDRGTHTAELDPAMTSDAKSTNGSSAALRVTFLNDEPVNAAGFRLVAVYPCWLHRWYSLWEHLATGVARVHKDAAYRRTFNDLSAAVAYVERTGETCPCQEAQR